MEAVAVYILVQTGIGEAGEVARKVAELEGVTAADTVTGHYDVIIQARSTDVNALSRLIAEVQAVPGIKRTLTNTVIHL